MTPADRIAQLEAELVVSERRASAIEAESAQAQAALNRVYAAIEEGKELAEVTLERDAALKRAEEAERERDEYADRYISARDDRAAVLNVKTTDGLTSSEWLMRTAVAERDLKASLTLNAKLVEALTNCAEAMALIQRMPGDVREAARWASVEEAHDEAIAALDAAGKAGTK